MSIQKRKTQNNLIAPVIISGKYKGRKLLIPDNARPVTSRVKRTIFDITYSYVNDAHILDIFAGSGNLGIEALSRGATHVTFVDNNPFALKFIRQNLENLGISEEKVIIKLFDYDLFIKKNKKKKFDLIFIDPPFELAAKLQVHLFIKILETKGIIVLKMPSTIRKLNIPRAFQIIKSKKMGNNTLFFLMHSTIPTTHQLC